MSRSYYTDATHPVIGNITVEWKFESHGYSGNDWDDPGEGPTIGVDEVRDSTGEIVWFMPNFDYSEIERLIYNDACQIDYEGPDPEWYE